MADEFLDRKRSLILKDLDTGFASYNRHASQIISIRGWNITLLVAYLGLLSSTGWANVSSSLLAAFFVTLGFWGLEMAERASLKANVENVMKIEKILSIEDQLEFEAELRKYKSRDLQLLEVTFKQRLSWAFSGMRLGVGVWYGFLLSGALVATIYLRSRRGV